ncbi:hypothetical protein JJB09_03155 [Rhizobium sp. KVB221]|uniref:Calcium-binding protein n=1 Tax=Rhizobium setariae TaxID=2801340 RepID=A0A937CKZ2_9HYPH|nr:hypothetical protein [Rhizobium setariae]MBL0371016.1 hypothetical protein [Rhizobium setariae]
MAATSVKKDRTSTWNIVGDDRTWTLDQRAKIDAEPAIVVAAGNDRNRLLINGDIDATGTDGIAIHDSASATRIVIARTADIRAVTGIHSQGDDMAVVNKGAINAASLGIRTENGFSLTNSGVIHATTAVQAGGESVIRNASAGEIRGEAIGVELSAGDSKLINSGLITGETLAIRDGDANSHIINRGHIEGDVALGGGNDIFDGRRGALQGSVEGGSGNDTYYVRGDMTIVENFDGGNDAVISTVSFTLPDNVEDLVLKGKADINGSGNNSSNQIFGNAGANELIGMAGDDDLRGGAGDDALRGGAGSDEFMIFPGEGVDTINDFGNGEDHIGIYNFGFSDVNDLTIKQGAETGGNVWIELGNGQRIIIEWIDKSVLDNSDFYFI